MSQISVGKLKSIAREYRLGDIACWPSLNDRPHLPPTGYMAFSEVILKAGDSFPLHPFVDDILQFFNVVLFQLTLNSYRIIVTFYIAFSEACEFEPSVSHFAYVFGIKARSKHAGFWYTTGQGDFIGIGGIPSNVSQ